MGAGEVFAVHAWGAGPAHGAFVDIGASGWGLDVPWSALAFPSGTGLAVFAVQVGVTSRTAELVHTNLSLEAVLVRVADLHTDVVQTLLSLCTVSINVTLPVAHATLASVLWRTVATRTP